MNCKKVWTRTHQNTMLKPSFVNNQLRRQQEQVFYEREMALFPATIDVIEDRRTVDNLQHECRILSEKKSAIIANIRYLKTNMRENHRRIELNQKTPKMYSDVNVAELTEQNRKLSEKYNIEHAEILQTNNKLRFLSSLLVMTNEDRRIVMANAIDGADPREILITLRQTGQIGDAIKRARTQFIRACPIESCRGFLSQQWKCGLCNVFTCSKCNVPKCNVPKCNVPNQNQNCKTQTNNNSTDTQDETDEHVCNPDDVATAELLAKDTKPCPQCGTGIFKIDGCDQMWCTECRTAFNWRTGNLETGHFHNPHYFEYQRRMGSDVRNILDMPCNALGPDQYHGILHHLIRHVTIGKKNTDTVKDKDNDAREKKQQVANIRERTTGYATSIHYFAERILPRYRPDAIQNNQELRVQYLTEQINLAEFKAALSREAKQFNRKLEIGQVIQTVVFGMSDILTRLINFLREAFEHQQNQSSDQRHYIDEKIILGMFSEIDALVEYANECLDFICKQYKLTRVALFVRDSTTSQPVGLFTVKQITQNTEEGPVTVLSRAKQI